MLTRRDLLLSSAAAAVCSSFSSSGAKAATHRVRHNSASAEGKAMVRLYAEGVKAMKALSDGNSRSWTFQWYTHATPRAKAETVTAVFGQRSTPARSLAQEVWFTCQSHQPNQPNDYFLPWHRLYVMYFEEIIRAVTGRPDFTLPYWDYTSASAYSIPEEFQAKNKGDPLFSALFMPNRNRDGGPIRSADVNAGEPLNKHYPGRRNFLVLPDLSQPRYSSFCSQLDQNLHGAVHTFTGDNTNMGVIPTAAGDPVFWLHHCNVDRIWAAWNATGKRNPTQTNGKAWADTKFVYVNGQGNRVEMAIDTIADSASLPYRYDVLPSPSGTPIVMAQNAAEERTTLLKSVSPGLSPDAAAAPSLAPAAVPLSAEAKTVMLAPTSPGNKLVAAAPSLEAGSASRLVLTLNQVQVHADPNTVYEVYLDLPEGVAPDTADDHYVGLLNFFGVLHGAHHGADAGRTVEFDVTNIVQRLNQDQKLKESTSVTLVPAGTPAEGSAPVISGGIELSRR